MAGWQLHPPCCNLLPFLFAITPLILPLEAQEGKVWQQNSFLSSHCVCRRECLQALQRPCSRRGHTAPHHQRWRCWRSAPRRGAWRSASAAPLTFRRASPWSPCPSVRDDTDCWRGASCPQAMLVCSEQALAPLLYRQYLFSCQVDFEARCTNIRI